MGQSHFSFTCHPAKILYFFSGLPDFELALNMLRVTSKLQVQGHGLQQDKF
jgi:hypothetical protein